MIFISKCLLIFLIIFLVNLSCKIFFLICSFIDFSVQMILQCVYSNYLFWFVYNIICSCNFSVSLIKSDFLLRMSVQLLFFSLQCWMIVVFYTICVFLIYSSDIACIAVCIFSFSVSLVKSNSFMKSVLLFYWF